MENNIDDIIDILIHKVDEMDKKDKTGLSLVEVMKPYSDLYNWSILKISQLSNEQQEKINKHLNGK